MTLAREIHQALVEDSLGANLPALFGLQDLRSTISELFGFYLLRIKARADGTSLVTAAGPLDEPQYRPAWGVLYAPLLSILAVAQEPLSGEQISAFLGSEM